MKKRSVKIAGHATSITMEDEFWDTLKSIAQKQSRPLAALITEIDAARGERNLSSAARIYVLKNKL
ncbi:MAG: ribbon-helix-helix domain-containing protein [Proteobacteria bacterium]|nr:ribbon-helix-helix domain-containing protein [Pseudomonadota bacterium]